MPQCKLFWLTLCAIALLWFWPYLTFVLIVVLTVYFYKEKYKKNYN
jgi:cytochrome c-type biogenesis protein CcmH/NrfF